MHNTNDAPIQQHTNIIQSYIFSTSPSSFYCIVSFDNNHLIDMFYKMILSLVAMMLRSDGANQPPGQRRIQSIIIEIEHKKKIVYDISLRSDCDISTIHHAVLQQQLQPH